MSRIPALDPASAQGDTKEMFEGLQKKMGGVINIFRTMGHSPALLKSYLGLSEILGKGKLSPAARESIALATAGFNGCDYCAAAHSKIGAGKGLSEDEIEKNLRFQSADAKTQGILTFTKRVLETRGKVSDADLQAAQKAGLSYEEIGEIVANAAINILTNFHNNIAQTDVDFPKRALPKAA